MRSATNTPQAPADTDPQPSECDDIAGRAAALVVDYTYPTRFNIQREVRQLVLDPALGLLPYPSEFLAVAGRKLDGDTLARKKAFDASSHLVVIEWGGSKPPHASWTYSRRLCLDFRKRGLTAVLDARRAWGLPTAAAGGSARRTARSAGRATGGGEEERGHT